MMRICVEDDYVSMAEQECYLNKLASQPSGIFPRVVRVLSWKEVSLHLSLQLLPTLWLSRRY